MFQTITVIYHLLDNDEPFPLNVSYRVMNSGDVRSVSCELGPNNLSLPAWLRMRKFDFSMLFEKGLYTELYNEKNYAQNLDTSLFIDQASKEIRLREKML